MVGCFLLGRTQIPTCSVSVKIFLHGRFFYLVDNTNVLSYQFHLPLHYMVHYLFVLSSWKLRKYVPGAHLTQEWCLSWAAFLIVAGQSSLPFLQQYPASPQNPGQLPPFLPHLDQQAMVGSFGVQAKIQQ